MIEDLIYDVGMHNGDDTAYYLYRGYRVVGIEANPVLAERCKARFAPYCDDGRLEVLNVGIGPTHGIFTFWVNDQNDTWSSFIREVGCRDGTPCHPVNVPCVPFAAILAKHGVPFYLKIDIEGADEICLHELSQRDLPKYVSCEASSIEALCLLFALGYNCFKCVDQTAHKGPHIQYCNESVRQRLYRDLVLMKWNVTRRLRLDVSPFGSIWRQIRRRLSRATKTSKTGQNSESTIGPGDSGPFGEETPGAWLNVGEVAYNWLHLQFGYRNRGSLRSECWYDFHATRKLTPPDNSPAIRRSAQKRPWWMLSRVPASSVFQRLG